MFWPHLVDVYQIVMKFWYAAENIHTKRMVYDSTLDSSPIAPSLSLRTGQCKITSDRLAVKRFFCDFYYLLASWMHNEVFWWRRISIGELDASHESWTVKLIVMISGSSIPSILLNLSFRFPFFWQDLDKGLSGRSWWPSIDRGCYEPRLRIVARMLCALEAVGTSYNVGIWWLTPIFETKTLGNHMQKWPSSLEMCRATNDACAFITCNPVQNFRSRKHECGGHIFLPACMIDVPFWYVVEEI